MVSIPLSAYQDVPVEPLAGKIVIDTNNYYWQRDGHFAELDDKTTTSAGLLQAHLPTSQVVKAFNHIQFVQLAADGQPAGTETGGRWPSPVTTPRPRRPSPTCWTVSAMTSSTPGRWTRAGASNRITRPTAPG